MRTIETTNNNKKKVMWTWLVVGVLFFVGFGVALTTITDQGIVTPTGDYDNITAGSINEVLYVMAGNETDLRLKVNQSRDAGGGIVQVPAGVYNIVNTINLSGDVIVQGVGVSTVIKPTGDFDVFLMCGGFTRVQNLEVNTQVSGYNSSAFSFIEDCSEESNWVYLDNLKIKGEDNTSNTDKAISLIDDGTGGPGITWVLIKNIKIVGYTYGIYLETSDPSAYVKGNTFENINFVETKYAIYENMSQGSSGGIQGNTFDVRMNGNSDGKYFAHIEGDEEYFYSVIFDPTLFSSGISYNITSKADGTMIIDNVDTALDNIIDDGTNTGYFISDSTKMRNGINMAGKNITNITNIIGNSDNIIIGNAGSDSHGLISQNDLFISGKLEVDASAYFDGNVFPTGFLQILDNRQLFFGTGEDSSIEWDETGQTEDTLVFSFGDTSKSIIFAPLNLRRQNFDHLAQIDPTLFIQSSTDPDTDNTQWLSLSHNKTMGVIKTGVGDLQIKSASKNITMTSPDGTEYTCGVANGGVLSCS